MTYITCYIQTSSHHSGFCPAVARINPLTQRKVNDSWTIFQWAEKQQQTRGSHLMDGESPTVISFIVGKSTKSSKAAINTLCRNLTTGR